MRVIAGLHRGRRLRGPTGPGLRPTADRVKEALFSILGERVRGAHFLDLYAGTGAIGIEALSRGAEQTTFVEPRPASLRVLQANLERCGLGPVADIRAWTAAAFLRQPRISGVPYGIVFADPPYHRDAPAKVLSLLAQGDMLAEDSIVILEHFTKLTIPSQVGRLIRLRQYRYGDTTLSVFRREAEGTSSP